MVALQSSVAACFVGSDTVLRLSGSDHRDWLQGQISQDVRKLSSENSVSTCFLSATGQLQAIARLHDQGDAILIVTGQPDVVEARVRDFVIMEDVEVETLSRGLWTLHGMQAEEGVRDLKVGRHDRTAWPGYDLLEGELAGLSGVEEPSVVQLDALGLEAGIPKFGVDTSAKTLPPELGKAFEAATISYTKGCYLGQEVVMRIYSRGHVNRLWIGIRLSAPVESGSEVTWEGKAVGTVMRAVLLGEGEFLAAAMVRMEAAEPGSAVTITGVSGTVASLPLTLEKRAAVQLD